MLKFGWVNLFFAFIVVIAVFGVINYNLSFWVIFLSSFLWLLITALGSANIQWNYFLNSLCSNSKIKENHISITFDDGPNTKYTGKILKLLDKHNAKATFFCIGKHAEKHPEIVKSILQNGHTIGNHTYSHSHYFGFFSTKKVINELSKTNTLLEKLTHKKTQLYRPAFGVTNPNIAKAIQVLNLKSIGWNVRSLDTTNKSAETVLKRITQNLKKGDIILLHDTSEKTLIVLEQLLLFLQEKNLKSVTVDQLLKIKAYA